jgi:hypothetical protein
MRSRASCRPWMAFPMAMLTLVVVLVSAACSANPAPAGSTRMALQTEGFSIGRSCRPMGVPPVRIDRDDDAILFIDVGTNRNVTFVWPYGFSAWLVDGKAVLYDSAARIVGVEGDILTELGVGSGDGVSPVCSVGDTNY